MQTIETWFLYLMIYSIAGWCYETTLCSVAQKRFINRGFLNGPYCPIYGFGAVLDLLLLGTIENPILLFFTGALVDCALEYFTSWAMEKLFHARWWDYSRRKFNIKGRVCLIGAVVFGAFSVVIVLVVHPLVASFVDSIPLAARHIAAAILFVGFCFDGVYTVTHVAGFHQKFEKLAGELADNVRHAKENLPAPPAAVTQALERFRASVNAQERRMLRAFPHYRWTGREGHEAVMRQVREFQERLRAAAKERRNALKNAKKK